MKKIYWIVAVVLIIGLGTIAYNVFKPSVSKELVEQYTVPQAIELKETEYDVVVIGTEPEGVAAAVSAARNGAKTLLIDPRQELGGLFTYGMLNFLDIPQGEDGKTVSEGIFKEWHAMVGNNSAFGIEEAKAAFLKLVQDEENITLSVLTDVTNVNVENNTIKSITVKNEYGEYEVFSPSFVDATQDADFAVMAGAPYFIGGEDLNIDKKMAVTLMIHLRGVDWERLSKFGKSVENYGGAEFNSTAGWGFTDLHYDYDAVYENTRLRGLNIARIGEDVYINALQIFGVDGLDAGSKAEAIELGKKEIDHIVEFFNKNFEGMEEAYVASYPSELYVRETRHVLAEYQLPMSDVWTNADHEDRIGYGAYPVDVQAQTPNDYGYVISDPVQYAIPFRSIVPLEIDGLLIASRSAGYSSLAAGSARIVPTGMVLGEAAGVAAVLSEKHDVTFREMSQNMDIIKELQKMLKDQGQYVDAYESEYPYQGTWYDESIQNLINYGALVGGYTNDLSVDSETNNLAFMNLIYNSTLRSIDVNNDELIERLKVVFNNEYGKEKVSINLQTTAKYLEQIIFGTQSEDSWNKLVSEGVISENVANNIIKEGNLANKDSYALISDYMKFITK